MEVAPRVPASQWLALRLEYEDVDWGAAVTILSARFRARYLDPIEQLLASEQVARRDIPRFGFTVLAIDCLLMETFQAFRDGELDTRYKSRKMFRRFLTQRPSFQADFNIERADAFYENVRCGVLHQAEVRGGWRVWAFGPLLAPVANVFRINRTEFHRRLVVEFESYKTDLLNGTAPDLRENVRIKMDHICRST